MADDRRLRALAKLLPAGVLGLSIGLAAAGAQATSATGSSPAGGSVAAKLKAIRGSVSEAVQEVATNITTESPDSLMELAWWGNGWHRWGWGNGGWGNGGWHNWGNGWGNGGWHNWGNGWHNW